MKQTDELTGTLVLVHPELTDDPAKRQGQIGIITGTDIANDDVFVGFGQSGQGLYSTNALLVFKSANEIQSLLMTDARKVSTEDFKTLMQVNLLQQHGITSLTRKAMGHITGNKVIRDLSMETLKNQLQRKQGHHHEGSFAR